MPLDIGRVGVTDLPVADVLGCLSRQMDVSPEAVETVVAQLLPLPQVDVGTTHHFAPGVYVREVTMPAGTFVIGHRHLTEHFNIVLTGRAAVMMEGQMHEIVAPCIFKSGAGVQKILYIQETMRWQTVHATDETDPDILMGMLVAPSPALDSHRIELETLARHLQST